MLDAGSAPLLVLLMTGPDPPCFTAVIGSAKECSDHDAQLPMMGLITVLWAFVGYSLVFSEGNPFIMV